MYCWYIIRWEKLGYAAKEENFCYNNNASAIFHGAWKVQLYEQILW
jgi:hypothetical protein